MPTWPLQTAIYAVLTGDTKLSALAGVHDHVPADRPHPYVTLGDTSTRPDDAHDRRGWDCTVTLHIWTRYRGNAQGLEILGEVDRLLHRVALVVPGYTHVSIAHEWHEPLRDPDPEIRHIPVRYRVWLEEE